MRGRGAQARRGGLAHGGGEDSVWWAGVQNSRVVANGQPPLVTGSVLQCGGLPRVRALHVHRILLVTVAYVEREEVKRMTV